MAERNPQNARSERHRRIERRYREGDPITEIAAAEGVDPKTVTNVARRAALPHRLPRQTERNERIVARYMRGDRVIDIANDEEVPSATVSTVARKAGLPPREGWQRRYPLNEECFDRPTSVGWWLVGLLAADGCLVSSNNCVSLSQRGQDADVLYEFYRYVGCPDRPLTELRWLSKRPEWSSSHHRYFEARIFSSRIRLALSKHGIKPRKTLDLKLSAEASSHAAVWLGLLDGDGSASPVANHGRPRIDFFGTRAVMDQCSAFWGRQLALATGLNPAVQRHRGGLSKVSLYGANAARAAEIMMKASPVSMRRKRSTLSTIATVDAHDKT